VHTSCKYYQGLAFNFWQQKFSWPICATANINNWMHETSDMQLLKKYAGSEEESAFAELVRRHLGLVYGVALRKTGNPQAAQDISQAVFIILAKKAAVLPKTTILSGWLYQTAVLTAANYQRAEARRTRREQEAYMQSMNTDMDAESELWPRLAPFVEDAMARLNEKDRNALLLRFLEGKSFREIGGIFGASENAAKKRVHYALEKLRRLFLKRGVSTTAALIGAALCAHAAEASPEGLAQVVTSAAMGKSVIASGSTLTLIKGTLKLMAWTKAKSVVVGAMVVATIASLTTTTLILNRPNRLPRPQPISTTQGTFPKASWVFAGYDDPVSAYMSFLWSHTDANLNALRSSLTPEETSRQLQELNEGAKKAGKSLAGYFASRRELPNVDGFEILSQQQISPELVILAVQINGPKGRSPVGNARMKKVGTAWKFDGMEAGAR